MSNNHQSASTRLQRLIGFVERDPGNTSLRADAASAAIDERQLDLAAELIERRPVSGEFNHAPALRAMPGIQRQGQRLDRRFVVVIVRNGQQLSSRASGHPWHYGRSAPPLSRKPESFPRVPCGERGYTVGGPADTRRGHFPEYRYRRLPFTADLPCGKGAVRLPERFRGGCSFGAMPSAPFPKAVTRALPRCQRSAAHAGERYRSQRPRPRRRD